MLIANASTLLHQLAHPELTRADWTQHRLKVKRIIMVGKMNAQTQK